MRTVLAIAAALCWMSAPAPAQESKGEFVLLHPGLDPPDTEGIVIPPGSPVRLTSFPRDFESNAAFRGRFTLSGSYQVEGYGEDAMVTMWPDEKSRAPLPYWQLRGGPKEIYVANGWAFAKAVVPREQLQQLKAGAVESVRGQVSIIADDYETSIVCDAANFSARFVALVELAKAEAGAASEEGC
jgi:hypothetical protein